MAKRVTLGGERLGSGNKMTVEGDHFERSTHDLSYLWRSTMSAGTLVPFLKQLALPGDTWDIRLQCEMMTHPTVGPLFGSAKVQLDTFVVPIRPYHPKLMNNTLGIGLKMETIKLPLLQLTARPLQVEQPMEGQQVNPSSLVAYMGIKGVGNPAASSSPVRTFNGLPFIMYFDICKNYYWNKSEGKGAVIHSAFDDINETVVQINIIDDLGGSNAISSGAPGGSFQLREGYVIEVEYSGAMPEPKDIILILNGLTVSLEELMIPGTLVALSPGSYKVDYDSDRWRWKIANYWRYRAATDITQLVPKVATFDLDNIDKFREYLLGQVASTNHVMIDGAGLTPYDWLSGNSGNFDFYKNTQECLGVKTYQSDLFNNWLSEESISGVNGISEVTSISTAGNKFTIDSFIIATRVYNMLNQINVSGGSYFDWIDAVYDEEPFKQATGPMYMGGLIKELVFQEVVSNTETDGQPLGTIAGRGVMGRKHKGGYVNIKVKEHSYILGIVSITPRIDYSSGNDWDMYGIKTMDDPHKPHLDQIGFQELITEQMGFWETWHDGTSWKQKSAGKQPAWVNYMTNVNKTYGNFALQNNEMFMTFNRRYESKEGTGDQLDIADLTTYIDPVKFNYIFAQTSLDAQNYWCQIAVDIECRRKMSAKVMPRI